MNEGKNVVHINMHIIAVSISVASQRKSDTLTTFVEIILLIQSKWHTKLSESVRCREQKYVEVESIVSLINFDVNFECVKYFGVDRVIRLRKI